MKTIGMILSIVLIFGFSILSRAQNINNESNNFPKLYFSPLLQSYEQSLKKQIKKNKTYQNISIKDSENIEKFEYDTSYSEESKSCPSSTVEYTTIFSYHNDGISIAMLYRIPLYDLNNATRNLPKKE